jgi:hypothetical protein
LVYYVPIYFQAILGTSAQDSGVRNLPYIIGSSKPAPASSVPAINAYKF